jgi:hypothetical protein
MFDGGIQAENESLAMEILTWAEALGLQTQAWLNLASWSSEAVICPPGSQA